MASSSTPGEKSVGYSQHHVRVQCDLCTEEENVTSHCTDCVKNMCFKCKQIHDKLHADHKFISVFEGRIIKHINTKCQTHHLVFTYYCEGCQINICSKCRKTTHNKCNLLDIDKHAEMLRIPFTKRLNDQRKHLPEIDDLSDSMTNHLTYFDNIIDNQISLIESETAKRHNDLDTQNSYLIKQLKSKKASVHETVHNQIHTLQDLKKSIDKITTSINTKINIVPDAGILQLVSEGKTKLDSTSIEMKFDLPNPTTFAPSSLWDQDINRLGSLRNAGNINFNLDTRVEPHASLDGTQSASLISNANTCNSTPLHPSSSLRHEISVVREFSLAPPVSSSTSDGSTCWVGLYSGWYSSSVQFLNQNGDQFNVPLSHHAEYTALTTTGELLVSGYNATVISRVNMSGEVRKFTDISAPGVKCVRGLVTTRQNDVFVCVFMTGNTKDKVLKLSVQGEKISELNSGFFTSNDLLGIHSVSRDVFCVQDGKKNGGRLVFIDGRGQLVRHIDRTTTELQRDITALAGDRHGHLIIGTYIGYSGGCIHVLSSEGKCEKTYHIKESRGISGVSVRENDVLWVGIVTGTLLKKLSWGDKGKLIVAKYLE